MSTKPFCVALLPAVFCLSWSPPLDAAESPVKLLNGRPASGPIRLFDASDGPRIVTATMHGNLAAMTATLEASPLDNGKPEPLLSATWPAVSITAWDVVRHGHGAAGAFVVALGGTNPIVMSIDGAMSRVSETGGTSQWESYRFPRFVARARARHDDHGATNDTSLTAIGERKLVLFSDGKRHDLIETDYGMVVGDRAGLAVLYTTPVPGAGRQVPPRHLHYARLNDRFEVGAPSEPLGDAVIYEFDAATSPDHTAIFASTDGGMVLVVASSDQHGLAPTEPIVLRTSGFVSSPSVLITKGRLIVAAIQDATVVTATLPLVAPRSTKRR